MFISSKVNRADLKNIVFKLLSVAILYATSASANAEDTLIDSNWYKHEFSVLWQSHIERDPEIKHFEEKLIPNKSAKTLYRTWVTNQCVTPGEKPYIAEKARDGHSPDIVPVFHGSPKADGKPILSPMDAATAQFTVELNHDRLETAYRNFIGEATEEKRLHAKTTLVEMCGAEAISRLDASLSKRKKAEPADVSSSDRNLYYPAFKNLWASHIERDPEIQFFEQKVIQEKNAKTLYRTWVLNACTVPGKEHYYNVKLGYGSPAEVSPVIYGPPEIEGKPILPMAEGISLMLMIKHSHEHLYTCACDYVREPSGKIHENAKNTIVEMCGEEAVARLDASLAKRKQTEAAEMNSPGVNWYYTALKNLWSSHIGRDPYLQFVELKLIKNSSARLAYKVWLTNMCTTPGDEQSITGLQSPNTTTVFHKAPIVDGKPIFDKAVTWQLNETVKSNRFKLATNLRDYVHTDSKEQRAKAKESLLEMCGAEAVERLDKAMAENKAIEQL